MSTIYFASPFFTDEQVEREERLKKKLRDLGFLVWSPKENCVCSVNATDEERRKVFNDNCNGIKNSDILFAVTDGKDMGTIWEAGYANGLNERCDKRKIIVYYCETLNGGAFNLMLANSGDIIITDFSDLDKLPELIEKGEKLSYVGNIE